MEEEMPEAMPIVDVPGGDLPKPPTDDLKTMAQEMTDEEMRALVIQNFRMLNEIVGFVRMAAKTLETLGSLGPVQSKVANHILPPEAMEMARQQQALGIPVLGPPRPPMNRAERRRQK